MQLPLLRHAAFTRARAAFTIVAVALLPLAATHAAPLSQPRISLARTVPVPRLPHNTRDMGRVAAGTPVTIALTLPLRNEADMEDMLTRIYDPNDALYQHYLTPAQFTARFAPTQQDYDAVVSFARAQGLTVTHMSPSRTLVEASGTREAVEAAFQTRLESYVTGDGRKAHANTTAPSVPALMASRISSIVGLNTVSLYLRPKHRIIPRTEMRPMLPANSADALPHAGTGPNGGLAPSDIKTAYSLTSVAPVDLSKLTGQGQQLGLYELDGYPPADIAAYVKQFNLPPPTLKNILYRGFNGSAGSAAVEVVLDIDMMLSLAPNATINVYEATNGTIDTITLFQKMADDNIAKSISTSFGLPEAAAQDNGGITAETHAFKQMALQGQSIFAASGDNGAYDDAVSLTVDDPASNPYMTGVGGTRLTTNATTQAYVSEKTWGTPSDTQGSPKGAGGGGGISALHAIPSYQSGINGSSTTQRNVPDVSLNADPESGYAISIGGSFATIGGTSAAAPLWAAFIGLVNEQRAKFGLKSTVGFVNPILYNIYRNGGYTSVFHDIADGSTNLYFVARTGYDNATGLGTFIGDQLLSALSPATSTPTNFSGTVTDIVTGSPVPAATITITCLQIPGLLLTPTYDPATGTFTATLDTSISTDTTAGKTRPLTYSVSADADGRAGDTQNVTLTQTQQVALHLSDPNYTFTPGVLEMISTPYEYSSVDDFAALFGLTPPLAGTGINLIAYSPTLAHYLYYPAAPADTFRRGQGYWARFPSPAYIRRRGKLTSESQFRVQLQAGWNQIGVPFPHSVTVSSIQVSAPSTAASATPPSLPIAQTGLVQFPLYGYSPPPAPYTTHGSYYPLDVNAVMLPWLGYWIYANQPAVLIFPGP